MPPGAISLDDVDLDQVSIDFVLNCVKKGCSLCSLFLVDGFLDMSCQEHAKKSFLM